MSGVNTPPTARSLRWTLAMLALYALAALGSLWLSAQPGKIAALWFASPVGTVALLALPLRRWLPMLLALAAVNLLAHLASMAGALGWGPATWLSAATFVPGNCVEMLLAAVLLRRLGMKPDVLHQPWRFGRMLFLGAVVPTFISAFAGAALVAMGPRHEFAEVWMRWFAGSLIGTVAMLPLALSIWLQGGSTLRRLLRQPRTPGLLLLSAAITLLAITTMPQPFVVVSIGLAILAMQTSFSVTALGTLLTAVLLGVLQATGVLTPPLTSAWWGGVPFDASFLASLLPGLFLSCSVEGQTQAMRQLLANEQRFRSLYTRTPAMLHSIDTQGRIVSVSRLWLQTLGYEEHEVLGRPAADFLTPDSARLAHEVVIPQSLQDGRCENIEYQMLTRKGQVLDVLLSAIWVYDREGQPRHSLAVVQDVTEKKRLTAISHFAEHDPLTGLPNRVLLQDRLERSCVRHARQGTRFAVGFLDLDHFKDINDRHGHEAGDRLLIEVARRLRDALRASDTVCRLAGDEFVLLFADIEQTGELEVLAAKILASVARPCRLGEGEDAPVVDVAASMGLAVFPDHGRDPQTLLAHADRAMYMAKHGGRNRCEFYRPEADGRTPVAD